LTAQANNVMAGYTYVGRDSDNDIKTGTLALSSNAGVGDVLAGYTFYNNNPHNKLAGTLALTGNAVAANVLNGKTFYNNNPKQKLTGTCKVICTTGGKTRRVESNLPTTGVSVTIPAHKIVFGTIMAVKAWPYGTAEPATPRIGISVPSAGVRWSREVYAIVREPYKSGTLYPVYHDGKKGACIGFVAINKTASDYNAPVSVSGADKIEALRVSTIT
ncbi:MAG: hypothetical protein II868_00675, partial [Butyrivibrio sp.]|nr:hypothetical protein [Butyrivibrio sp.]